jgi:uncharacterized Zn-binding protein involved in type VI secretion
MTTPYVSQTQYGKNELFELQVARGQIQGHRNVTVFGFNPDVDTSQVSVWPLPSLITFPAAALQMTVSSTSANDTAAGTGARTVVVQGLDANYNEVTETVTLNGQTAVTMSASLLRVNYAYVATAGSDNSAAGDIYIGTGTVTAGVPATTYDIIKFDYNNTTTGSYTVPANYTAYVSQGLFSSGQTGGSNQVQGRLLTRGTNNIRMTAALTSLNNGVANYVFEYPLAVPEKTTIEATAVGSSTNNSVSSMFIILLVKNSTGY